jgi:hypothetical protein
MSAPGSSAAQRACAPADRAVLWSALAGAGAGVQNLLDARRQTIRSVASRHRVRSIRWWSPTASAASLDFLVEGLPESVPGLRSELERVLGCRVAIYLADQIPREAWGGILAETVTL